ncbi:MAG: hypothetical protein JWN85_1567 [Gammaproteobacteria bacterium]|nr:hypothetical protein [Gammaproteobacteria bacterium]
MKLTVDSRSLFSLALSVAFAVTLPRPAWSQSTEPLLQQSNLAYQGAFRVPQGSSDTTTFDYGGTALTYNPGNKSLYMVGHDWYQLSAEISIPSIVNSTNISSLATATILQTFADSTQGKLNQINPSDPNTKKVGGQLVYNGKLVVAGYSFYDGSGAQSTSHFARPLSLSTTGQVQGPVRIGTQYPGFVSGYMTLVPPEWQSQLGGPALTGNCCLNIISEQSNGPAVSVFDPSKLGVQSPVPATPLVGYPYPHILGPSETSQNQYFNLTTKITGVVFPVGTRSVLFFGRHGTGPYCYGPGTPDQSLAGKPADGGVDVYCYDPADSSKGTHAYPYAYQVWAYDAIDLASVKNGTKLQYQITPYAVWTFHLPFESSDAHLTGGAGYDPQTNSIYLSQRCEDTNCAPIIHVFKVNGTVGTVTTPDPPTNLQVH